MNDNDTLALLQRLLSFSDMADAPDTDLTDARRRLRRALEQRDPDRHPASRTGANLAALTDAVRRGDLDAVAKAESLNLLDEIESLSEHLNRIDALADEPPPALIANIRAGISRREGAGAEPAALTSEDIRAFLSGAKRLSLLLVRELFRNPKLKAEFQRLKRELLIIDAPALRAAASDREIEKRDFEGGSLRLRPAGRPGQVVVLLALDLDKLSELPGALYVERAEDAALMMFPSALDDGQIVMIKNLSDENDDLLVRLLRDPSSRIELLKRLERDT